MFFDTILLLYLLSCRKIYKVKCGANTKFTVLHKLYCIGIVKIFNKLTWFINQHLWTNFVSIIYLHLFDCHETIMICKTLGLNARFRLWIVGLLKNEFIDCLQANFYWVFICTRIVVFYFALMKILFFCELDYISKLEMFMTYHIQDCFETKAYLN